MLCLIPIQNCMTLMHPQQSNINNKIIEVAKECENALIAGEDLVCIHLLEKQDKLQWEMVEASNVLEKKRNVWLEKRVEDLEDSIISIKEKFNDMSVA